MDKRIKEANLLEHLFDAYIKWHIRKGLRDCDCDYCITKKAGTRYIGYTPFPLVKYKEEIGKLNQMPMHNLDTEEIAKDLIKDERERKRRIVRDLLHISRQKIL